MAARFVQHRDSHMLKAVHFQRRTSEGFGRYESVWTQISFNYGSLSKEDEYSFRQGSERDEHSEPRSPSIMTLSVKAMYSFSKGFERDEVL